MATSSKTTSHPHRQPTPKGRKASSKRRTSRQGGSRHQPWVRRLVMVLIIGLIGWCAVYLLSGQQGHRGIDVSHHQGNIDWQKVASDNDIEFVFIKATEGIQMTDPKFHTNRRQAHKQGLLVGAYHFMLPKVSGAQQFDHFADVVGRDIDLRPVLDLENPLKGDIGNDEAYRTEVKAWIDACTAEYGCPPIVYASPSFVRDHQLSDVISHCPYWIAWYTRMPHAVSSRRHYLMLTHPGTQAILWQYTDKGSVRGISSHVDLNECWEMATLRLR